MELGALVSKYRKEAKLTIDELAEISGVPKGTINKIISGATKSPTVPNMKALAKAMGKTLADFDDPVSEIKKAPPIEDGDMEMLGLYHKLDNRDQGRVLGYMDHLLESEKYKEDAV